MLPVHLAVCVCRWVTLFVSFRFYTPLTSLESLLTANLGLSLKSRCQKKKIWSKRINHPRSSSFANPGIKPLKKTKSIFYAGVTGRCCPSRTFLFRELCPPSCLMCQCWQPWAVSFRSMVNPPFFPRRCKSRADLGRRRVRFALQGL